MRGQITREKAERRGLDGREACAGARVSGALAGTVSGDAGLAAGFATDFRGLVEWGGELALAGARGSWPDSGFPDQAHLICWFTGAMTVSRDDVGMEPAPSRTVIVGVRRDGPGRVTVLASADGPLPVFAPPLPAQRNTPPDVAGKPVTAQLQPEGVVVGGRRPWND